MWKKKNRKRIGVVDLSNKEARIISGSFWRPACKKYKRSFD